jgi:GT2 family glycosyltransferase
MKKLIGSIVTYNTKEDVLAKAINSFNEIQLDKKLIIVDNSPTDKLKEMAEAYQAEYIHNIKNTGYGAAHNIALKRSLEQAEYHLVFNPDIFWDKGTIENIYEYMQNNTNVGQLMPKVLYPNGELQYLCKLLPTPADLFFRRFLQGIRLLKNRNENFELRFTGYDKIMNIPYLSGCFMFFRTAALQKVGLFDERFFMYPEDIDITRRMHKLYKTLYYPQVYVYHDHAKESYATKKMLWLHIINMIKYFNKWGWIFDKERKEINCKTLENL